MITIKTLEYTSLEDLYKTFIKAFSDYEVPMTLSLDSYKNMLLRRGYKREFSVGLFDYHKLVGFLCNGVGAFENQETLYDLTTGIIPEYRSKGYSKLMFQECLKLIKDTNISVYLLEVLENNKTAIKVYESLGFIESRELLCYKEVNEISKTNFNDVIQDDINMLWDDSFIEHMQTLSWQNSLEAIHRDKTSLKRYSIYKEKDCISTIVFSPITYDVALIVTKEAFRRQGYGSQLLNKIKEDAKEKSITFLNIDSDNMSLNSFLNHHGFKIFVKQKEMKRNL